MAKIDGLDGLCNIQDRHIICLTQALDFFVKNDLASLALQKGWSKGDMLQALASPLHSITNEYKRSFIFSIPDKKAKTKNGNDASPAIATYTTTMGLSLAEKDDFALTSISQMILNRSLSIPSYALILLSKVGIYVKGERVTNLLTQFSKYAIDNFSESYTKDDFNKILKSLGENASFDSREDIAFNAFVLSGILSVTGDEKYKVRKEDKELIELLVSNGDNISGPIDGDNYMGDINKGIIELITSNNKTCFSPKYNDLINIKLGTAKPELTPIRYKSDFSKPLQQIFYGAPGTGKSYSMKDVIAKHMGVDVKSIDMEADNIFRTTFHPDYDYAQFVGCYKPTKDAEKITYDFMPQVFTNALVKAYESKQQVYLVIEEINRGNCAQIFGDIFQLLDRNGNGESEYSISVDEDLRKYLETNCPESIKEGKIKLPANLSIIATMNTSDQSLFPMDSAFKRRWEWVYVPIKYNNFDKDGNPVQFRIIVEKDKFEYDWNKFQKSVNGYIVNTTHSEDKQMGDYFIKKNVTLDEFVNKVMFYLWNDVCKENYHTEDNFFRTKDEDANEETEFSFGELMTDKANLIIGFMRKLNVDNLIKESSKDEDDSNQG